MTIQPFDSHELELYSEPVNPTGGRLMAWAEAASAAGTLGSALSKTSFVPKDFRGKPEECAAAILFGDEIGLSPMQSLQSIYVISGKPALYARAMLAIVLAAGHEVVTIHKTDKAVTVKGRRRGSDTWIEEQWTTERARRAGYTSNKRYELDPQSMLLARAMADVCRQIAPDALAGLSYSVEELELAEPAPTAKVTRSQAPTGTRVQRKAVETAAKAAAEEPAFDNPDSGEATAVESVLLVSDEQLKRMTVAFTSAGIVNADHRLAYVVDTIGRDIASSKELTQDESETVIAGLEALQVGPGNETGEGE
jgi:hypothetical protein